MRALLYLSIFLPSIAFSNTQVKLTNGKTEFSAVGNPGFLKIDGKGDGPKGKISIVDGVLNAKLSVDLKSLDTGMSLRNKHLKEKYLKVDQFPEATLEIKNYKMAQWTPETPQYSDKKVPAILTLQNNSQPIVVAIDIDNSNKLVSSFEMKISDFKIEIPSFMGVTVADMVTVKISSSVVAEKDDSMVTAKAK